MRECESDGRERGERRALEGLEDETSKGTEGDGFVGVRSRAKKGSFGVESKWFDVEVAEQKGKVQATIVERKGGVSSWIRLGPKSIECFIDGLVSCIKIAGSDIRERKWKESGRSYSLVRDQNKGGLFLRIGVMDLENKRFCIFIPKGKGDKSGWVLMVEMLQRLGCYVREESYQKEDALMLSPCMGKTYAEVAKQPKGREKTAVRVELCKRELSRNLEKLAHYLVGS